MHVYVLEADHGCKIGRSANPTERLRNLSTQGGFAPISTWVSLPVDDAAGLERAAHASLSGCRGLGEWFAVDFEKAVSTVVEAMSPKASAPSASEIPVMHPDQLAASPLSVVFAYHLAMVQRMRGLSDAEVGRMSGTSGRAIGMYRALSAEPSINRVQAISQALGYAATDFLSPHFQRQFL